MDIKQIIHDVWEGDNELSTEECVAIEKALQEQAEREKGCEYCNTAVFLRHYNSSEEPWRVAEKYCPVCGRRKTDGR